MVHVFHFLLPSLVFDFRGYLMSSPVTKVAWFRLDVRTLEFFPPAESWLVKFPRASRMVAGTMISSEKVTSDAFDDVQNIASQWMFLISSSYNILLIFPAEAQYSYFSSNYDRKIYLWIFLDYNVWHICFGMYLVCGWCWSNSGASLHVS